MTTTTMSEPMWTRRRRRRKDEMVMFSTSSLLLLLTSLLLLLLLPFATTPSHAKVTDDNVSSSSDFVFLEKFCYDSTDGKFVSRITADPSLPLQTLLLFDDLAWAIARDSSLQCSYRTSLARGSFGAIANASYSGLIVASRPKWWFIVASNCLTTWQAQDPNLVPPTTMISLSYTFTFTNGLKSQTWRYQFGADEQGVAEASIVFFVYFTILFTVLVSYRQRARRKQINSRMFKFLLVSSGFAALHHMFVMSHRILYSSDGRGSPPVSDAATVFEVISQSALLATCFRLSRGWPISTTFITRHRLQNVLIFIYFVVYIFLAIFMIRRAEAPTTSYVYASAPGFVAVVVRLIAFVVFLRWIMLTQNKETDALRKTFYRVFAFGGGLWLLSLPIIVLIMLSVDDWVRLRVSFAVTSTVHAAMLLWLTVLFRPFRTNHHLLAIDPTALRAFEGNKMQVFPEMVEFTSV